MRVISTHWIFRKSGKRSSASNETEKLRKENLSLKSALFEAEKGWKEAILFAREMQLHLRENEERLHESYFQIEALRDQLAHIPKIRSFSSGSELSLNSQPPMGGGATPEVSSGSGSAEPQQTAAAKISLLESELQLYRRQIQKQQESWREFKQQLHGLVIDLSLSHSTLLASFQTLIASDPFRSNTALKKDFQDITRKSIHRERDVSPESGNDDNPKNSSPYSEEMILSDLSEHIKKTNLLSSWCRPLQAHLIQIASRFDASPLAPPPPPAHHPLQPQIIPRDELPTADLELSLSTGSSSLPCSSSSRQSQSQHQPQERSDGSSGGELEWHSSLEQRISWEMRQLREQMRAMSSSLLSREVSHHPSSPSKPQSQPRDTDTSLPVSSTAARRTQSPKRSLVTALPKKTKALSPSPSHMPSQSPPKHRVTSPGRPSRVASPPKSQRPLSPGSRVNQSPLHQRHPRSISPKRKTGATSLSNSEPPARSPSPSGNHLGPPLTNLPSRLFAPGPPLLFPSSHTFSRLRSPWIGHSPKSHRIDQGDGEVGCSTHATCAG
jgi:hypothetical protein